MVAGGVATQRYLPTVERACVTLITRVLGRSRGHPPSFGSPLQTSRLRLRPLVEIRCGGHIVTFPVSVGCLWMMSSTCPRELRPGSTSETVPEHVVYAARWKVRSDRRHVCRASGAFPVEGRLHSAIGSTRRPHPPRARRFTSFNDSALLFGCGRTLHAAATPGRQDWHPEREC